MSCASGCSLAKLLNCSLRQANLVVDCVADVLPHADR